MKSAAKRHHYLPQSYLEGFCREDGFWVYDRKDDEYRKQTPVNTTVQKHYYSIEEEDGEKNIEIEKMLSQLEGSTKKVINKIVHRKLLSNKDKMIMSLFISFAWTRIPDFERLVNESMKSLIKKTGDILNEDVDRIKQAIERCEKDTGEKIAIDPAKLKEFWDKGKFDIVMNRNASLDMMLQVAPEYARLLCLMDWVFTIAPKDYSFITTDSPFVLIPTSDEKIKTVFGSNIGLLVPGVEKLFPISQKICLVIRDCGGKIKYAEYNKSLCKEINMQLARHAKRFVIGRDKALLRSLVKKAKVNRGQRCDTFRMHEIGPYQILKRVAIEE